MGGAHWPMGRVQGFVGRSGGREGARGKGGGAGQAPGSLNFRILVEEAAREVFLAGEAGGQPRG